MSTRTSGGADASGTASQVPASGTAAGKAALQPPVAYLPCRLDEQGQLAEVMLVELGDGRVALLGYSALDRFVAACGDAHPWVVWQTAELEQLRDLKPFDVAYLDMPLPPQMRLETAPADGPIDRAGEVSA